MSLRARFPFYGVIFFGGGWKRGKREEERRDRGEKGEECKRGEREKRMMFLVR